MTLRTYHFPSRGSCVSNGNADDVWKLITSHGIEITATPNHRFLTTEGYKRLDELQFGDTLSAAEW